MLVIDINKDLDEYTGNAVMGLSWKQCLSFGASAGISIGMIALLQDKIGLVGSCYLAIPVVMPIALNGFYSKNGMNFTEYVSKSWNMMFRKPLLYVSEEGPKQVEEKKKGGMEKKQNSGQKNSKKPNKKPKKALFGSKFKQLKNADEPLYALPKRCAAGN